ncbi:hypothetical protein NPIL_461751 [Nephila pilipes]|uniref:Uncharacterized protein n=1 Tax=Nephila pilipes TaxID=299642 RepID=A0A8X6Q612_NEPPI|nr:hypothetical protein NPIL_461751 [Nephila pilipes]
MPRPWQYSLETSPLRHVGANSRQTKIPKLGYYASDSNVAVRDALMEIYFYNITQDYAEPWSWRVPQDELNRQKSPLYGC